MQSPAQAPFHPLRNPAAGFTMVSVLLMLIVLSMLGVAARLSIRGDIHYAGRDMRILKAKVVAENAANWAQEALANPKRAGLMSYIAGTHDATGNTALAAGPLRLNTNEVAVVYPGEAVVFASGWISISTTTKSRTLTQSASESMAFKVWYPDNATVRIQGRGTVEGVSAVIDVSGEIN